MKLWRLCHSQRSLAAGASNAIMLPITIEAAHHICLIYDVTVKDFEKIVLIDKLMLPFLREKSKGE